MPKRISEAEIDIRIVPMSVRWREGQTVAWDKLLGGVTALKALVRKLDNECVAAEGDRGLSAEGIALRHKELAQKALVQLANFAPMQSAEKAVANELAALEERMIKLPSSPTEVSDLMLAAEIRSYVAQQKNPVEFAFQSVEDNRVLGAVIGAPAFLSGLTDEHLGQLREKAREKHNPQQVEKQRSLRKALADLQEGVEATKRLVLQRTEMRMDSSGELHSKMGPGQAA